MGSDEDDSKTAGLSSDTVEGASRRGIESQQRAEQGLSRVINAKLAAAFRTWVDVAAVMAAQERMLSAAVSRWTQRMLSAAWNTWREQASQMKEDARKLRWGVMKMIAYQLAAAMAQWREQAGRGIDAQQRAQQGLSRVINAKLAAAFRKVKHCSTTTTTTTTHCRLSSRSHYEQLQHCLATQLRPHSHAASIHINCQNNNRCSAN